MSPITKDFFVQLSLSDWVVWQLRDSGVTLQNTVNDIEEHLMSLLAVSIKYNVQTKNITETGFFDSITFVTLSSSASVQITLDYVE
mgnify:CR=1 FL=1